VQLDDTLKTGNRDNYLVYFWQVRSPYTCKIDNKVLDLLLSGMFFPTPDYDRQNTYALFAEDRYSLSDNNILNLDPKFMDVRDFDFRLDTLSPAKDKGQELMIMKDLDGNLRDNLPDIGAYERIE